MATLQDQATYSLYELSGYIYDRRTMRFHGPLPSYAMIPNERMMALVQERIDYHQFELVRLTNALDDGLLTLRQWMTAFARELKDLHLQQAALAHGGWQNMRNVDFLQVARTLKEQYAYLHQFGLDIALGYPPARWAWRAGLYAYSGRESYWLAAQVSAKSGNMHHKRRIARGDKGTCGPCDDQARRGWVPIDAPMPAPGSGDCKGLTACRCEMEFR